MIVYVRIDGPRGNESLNGVYPSLSAAIAAEPEREWSSSKDSQPPAGQRRAHLIAPGVWYGPSDGDTIQSIELRDSTAELSLRWILARIDEGAKLDEPRMRALVRAVALAGTGADMSEVADAYFEVPDR